MSTIPLAKGFSEKHLKFPVLLSRKFDGVPVRIDIDSHGCWTSVTRQGNDMPSIRALGQAFVESYMNPDDEYDCVTPVTIIGEVVQHGNWDADFKETSGIVRKQTDQSHRLAIMVFEAAISDDAPLFFDERYTWMDDFLSQVHGRVHVVEQTAVENMEQLVQHQQEFNRLFPQAEGLVARNHNDPWAPGKRSWGYQKLLNEPTIDLRIVRVEEATAADGTPKGMVGRLVASYKGTEIGIGPGRLTHAERTELWEEYKFENSYCCCGDTIDHHPAGHAPVSVAAYYKFPFRVAQIKHKGDDSYSALRQPTFQHWRDDKDEADA